MKDRKEGSDAEQVKNDNQKVICSICGKEVSAKKAHLHQGVWIGDECCWDARLKASE